MSVDSAAKRLSMLDLDAVGGIAAPDGTIGAGDRLHFLLLYSGILASEAVAAAAAEITGMGPGWNLFHPTSTRKPRRDREEIEEELLRIFERANEAETPRAQKRAVRELKEIAREAVEDGAFAERAAELQKLLQFQMSALAFLNGVGEILARQRAMEQDDMEAFMMIAEAA